MHAKLRLLLCSIMCSVAVACSQGDGRNNVNGFFGSVGRAPDFVAAAKTLQPAVVNVLATVSLTVPGQEHNGERFFGVPPPARPSVERSQGSGFIIGSDGVIVTNAHVVDGATKIVVRLADKREFSANVVGSDPHTDVAIIKIATKENLPTLKLGDSDHLEVGEWVMAVGNPFGLDNSLSSGIVSAKGRYLGDDYDRLIQTDANLNPGSSGGPLVDLNGNVVGINKAIISQGGGNLGIGFATPINLVKEILPELQTSGKVTRGWAGVVVQEITPVLAETMGLKDAHGALVAGIVGGSPAEVGGIKVGDIITEYDGKTVNDALELPLWIARTPLTKRVAVKLKRDNQEMRVDVVVAALPNLPAQTQVGKIG
jgi:serine protease Do